jgi:endonuclease/exonuclease/phosphatase family metal-dependent hydrolase
MIFLRTYSKGFLLAGVSFFLVSCGGCSLFFMEEERPDRIRLLSYNVQNLFDDVKDGTEYEEFVPGEGEWSEELYHLKMLQLSEVINRTPPGGADIVLLQEVENQNALDALNTHYLKGAGYRYSLISDGEGTAVNSAVLSRFPFTGAQVHSVSLEGSTGGRPVLEVRVETGDLDFVLLNCHWKSKSGGAEKTEDFRRAAAAVISRRLYQLRATEPMLPVVVGGDLNENFDEWDRIEGAYPTALRLFHGAVDESLYNMTGGTGSFLYLAASFEDLWSLRDIEMAFRSSGDPIGGFPLFSPWIGWEGFPGSYHYGGQWETIDHFLLNSAFGDAMGLEYEGFEVLHTDMILDEEGFPYRWSPLTAEGYSDHLPLLLTLTVRER